MKRPISPKSRNWILSAALLLALALAVGALGWCRWVYVQIERYAVEDQAAPSDAIGVFGAAEYDGRPSPVYRARLDHALVLYRHGIAPLLITLGGNGGDQYNEGAVGREYLVGMGVPASAIIAETESRNTAESARRIAVIARTNGLRRLVIVSDGTHLFRIHEICAADGLDVLTSPRPRVAVEGGSKEAERIEHEILSYTAWRLDLH
jgi:vancomycin permeability regulator SanA